MTGSDPQRPLSTFAVGDFVEASARRWPERACFVTDGASRTFAEVHDRVDRLAAGLRSLGLGPGDRIGILATDSFEHMELILACLRSGVVFCDLNFRMQVAEVRNVLEAARPATVFIGERYRSVFEEVGLDLPPERVVLIDGHDDGRDGPTLESLIAGQRRGLGPGQGAYGEELVSIAFTSGTTGVPKGVMQSERMVRNLVYQGIQAFRIEPGGFRYSGAPMFHVSGFLSILYAIAAGCSSLVLPQFEARSVLRWMQEGGLTHCTLIPTMISSILELPEAHDGEYPELRTLLYGGAPMTPSLLRRTWETFGCDLYNGFGAGTEAGLQTLLGPEEHRRAMEGAEHLLSSIGRPVVGVDLRLCDDELRDVAPGEVGEIVTRSETVMSGYLGQPELTARSVVDGWFRAGDMAQADDDGYLYLATRKSDMIVRGGENVYPIEIESTLSSHPAVLEVAVVPLPDDHWGEIVGAGITLRADAQVSAQELRTFCRERLAGYKVPEVIEFFSEMPKNSTGKLIKPAVAEMLAVRRTDEG